MREKLQREQYLGQTGLLDHIKQYHPWSQRLVLRMVKVLIVLTKTTRVILALLTMKVWVGWKGFWGVSQYLTGEGVLLLKICEKVYIEIAVLNHFLLY